MNLGTIAQRLDPPQHQPYKLKITKNIVLLLAAAEGNGPTKKGRAITKCMIDGETQQQSHYFPPSSTTMQPKKASLLP